MTMKVKFHLPLLFCFVLLAINCGAQMLEPMLYIDGKQKLTSWLGLPTINSKNKAGVLIIPAWMGKDDNAYASGKKLAVLGYYTLVADIYGEGSYPADAKKAKEIST